MLFKRKEIYDMEAIMQKKAEGTSFVYVFLP